MKLEIGKKYVCRNKYSVKYVTVDSWNNYNRFDATLHYKNGTSATCEYNENGSYFFSTGRNADLVAEYKENATKFKNMRYLISDENTWNEIRDTLLKEGYKWFGGGFDKMRYISSTQLNTFNTGEISHCLSSCNNYCPGFSDCKIKDFPIYENNNITEKCECGAQSCGYLSHSSWCPLYIK